jgi:hypothetical protein
LLGKGQQIIIIFIFIIGLHSKPHGYSASVASAAGSFTTKKETRIVTVVALQVLNAYIIRKPFTLLFLMAQHPESA